MSSICDDCKYAEVYGEQPCTTCMQWVDGELDATNYEPVRHTDNVGIDGRS